VDGCNREKIPLVVFATEKKHSYNNLKKAVNDLLSDRGCIVGYYESLKYLQRARSNLDAL
jgi:hypothetical protein